MIFHAAFDVQPRKEGRLRFPQICLRILPSDDSASMDFSSVLTSVIGFALTLGLVYYSVRTIALFKSSVAARAWVYISLSAIFFSVGVVFFLVEALATMGLLAAGGILDTVGAVFLFLGLRKNFLFWASNDHFA